MKFLFTSIFLLFFPCVITAQIFFEDRAAVIGLTNNTGTAGSGGSGVSFVDYNNDGFDDITLASGDGVPVRFYKNIDGVFFIEETLLLNSYNYRARGITWIDYDNDGDKDLFLASDTDGNRLFQNQNNVLIDVTVAAGFPTDNILTHGISWGDIDNDGCLDVYLSNRINATAIINYLFKNNCDGTFTDVTQSVGLDNEDALSFCSAFFDFNNDGFQDLYVANDKLKQNRLYKNDGDGTFTDVSATSNTNIIVDAMSVTVDDFNADGFFDIFITNTPNNLSTPTLGSVLLKNNGDETFTDISVASGTVLDSFSWGSSFFDAENDGDLDLYLNCQYTSADNFPSYAFYKNDGNETFSEPSNVGFTTNDYVSYACAVGDFNNDGKQEIISNNDNNTNPSLWANTSTTNSNNYLKINLEGTLSNKDGIGSVVEISINGVKQYRTIMAGEGYLAQNSLVAHFGVGNVTTIDFVKVTWLSGQVDRFNNINVNQELKIVEGSPTLGTTGIDNKNKISFIPNPVHDRLVIKATSSINKIQVFDISGKQIDALYFTNNEIEFNTSHLISGMYFIKVFTQDNSETIKILKQ